MAEGPILSVSSVTAYLRCHYRWYLSNVLRLRGAQSMAAAVGQAVHSGVEAHYTSPVRPEAAAQRAFDFEVAAVPAPEVAADPGAFSDAVRLIGTYLREVAPRRNPTMVERPFLVRVDGTLVSGTIDNADENKDEVYDIKTTSMISKFHPESYDLQLSIYDMGYTGLTGRRPKRLVLDVLSRGGRVPYREIVREPDLGAAVDVLSVVRDGVSQGNYEPTGSMSGQCRWCPFRISCRYAVIG